MANKKKIEEKEAPLTEETVDKNELNTETEKDKIILDDSDTEQQIAVFGLGDIEFGININQIKEIVRVENITKIPNSPDFIDGITNLRGLVLPIINSRLRFSMGKIGYNEQTRILVIDNDSVLTGLVVDEVKEVIHIHNDVIEKAPAVVKGVQGDFLQGVMKLDNGKRLILMIDVQKTCFVDKKKDSSETGQSAEGGSLSSAVEKRIEKKILDEELIVTFIEKDSEFAFPIKNVNEIIRVSNITSVPNSPVYVKGVISLRDNVLPVIDLRAYHGIEKIEYDDAARIIVLNFNNRNIGLLVDKVTEVFPIEKSIISQAPDIFNDDTQNAQLSGIAKFDDGKRLIMMLNPSTLFQKSDIENIDKVVQEQGGTMGSINEKNENKKNQESESLFVTFKLDKEEYGININNVQEINRLEEVTYVPNSPDFIEGVTNLRGDVVPLISLRKRFSMELKEYDDKTRLIIVEVDNNKTALIVDSVSEVIPIADSKIDKTPQVITKTVKVDFISGIAKLKDGKQMIMMLNMQNVLSEKEKQQLEDLNKK